MITLKTLKKKIALGLACTIRVWLAGAATASSLALDLDARKIGSWNPGLPRDRAFGIAIAENHAYVAAGRAGLVVIDISNPADPKKIGSKTGVSARALAVSGQFAYVLDREYLLDREEAMLVFDISDASNPQRVGFMPFSGGMSIAVSGDYAYLIEESGMTVIDIANPAQPAAVRHYLSDGAYLVGFGVTAIENYAYVFAGIGLNYPHLRVLDISDPRAPNWAAQVPGMIFGVAVSGGLVHAADAESGLAIFELTKRPNPQTSTGISFSHWLRRDQVGFRGLIHGTPGLHGRIQRSTDLIRWQDWKSVTFGGGPLELFDPEAASGIQSFYRMITP